MTQSKEKKEAEALMYCEFLDVALRKASILAKNMWNEVFEFL